MAVRRLKRVIITSGTLIGVSLLAFALWQNITKRQAVKSDPVAAAIAYPNYSPALILANQVALSTFGTAENQRLIAEGKLVFSDADANAVKERAKRAFAAAPLTVGALSQIATADFLKTLIWSDRDLLRLVKSRNARDRQTLMALTSIDVRGGDFEALFENFDLRHRLQNLGESDLQIIKALSTLPDQRSLIENQLAAAPSWGEDYFRAVIPNWTEEEIVNNRKSLFIFLEAQDDDFVRQTLLRFYFQQLRRLNLYETALQDWADLPEVKASGPKMGSVYNADFQTKSAPQPFNWRTYEPSLALAEIEPTGGLYASSSAPKRTLLAQQLTTAPTAQALRLEIEGKWQYRERQGHFFWRLSCMPARAPFYDIKMGDSARESGLVTFDIPPLPEGCDYQDLQLYSEPSGFNQRVSLQLSRVDILPRQMSEAERAAQSAATLQNEGPR